MKLTATQLIECKESRNVGEIIHLSGKYYAEIGTFGMTILKRLKFEFSEIVHFNSFRNLDLKTINDQLK